MNRLNVLLNHLTPNNDKDITLSNCSASNSTASNSVAEEEVFLPLKIVGMGRYLPQFIVESSTIDRMAGKPIGYTERTSGVKRRRMVQSPEHLALRRNGACISKEFYESIDEKTKASFDDSQIEDCISMAAKASREALSEAGIKPEDLSLILFASATPERALPDSAPFLQKALGISETGIPGFSIHSSCLSFLVGLQMAGHMLPNMARQKPNKKPYILIVSADVPSCGLNFVHNPHSAGLMGDAAAAAVVTLPEPDDKKSGIVKFSQELYGDGAEYTTIRSGGSKRHPSFRTCTQNDLFFSMNGRKVLEFTADHVFGFLERFHAPLVEQATDEFVAIIPHQTSKAGMTVMFDTLGWPREKLVQTLEECGNTVSVSLPLTLYEAIKVQKRLKRGDRFFMIGTGAGLNLAGAIINY